MAVLIGTSGWSYDHWVGVLYPRKASSLQRLDAYAREFRTVEVNNTFYRWPKDEVFATWHDRLPEGFLVSAKASRGLTQFRKLNDQYNNSAPFDGNVEYGFSVGYLFVQALKAAGKDLTRQGIVQAVEKGGFTGPGLAPFRYSKTDHSGYRGLQMGKVQGGKQLLFGPVYTTDDAGGPVEQSSTAQPVPPENGIPA